MEERLQSEHLGLMLQREIVQIRGVQQVQPRQAFCGLRQISLCLQKQP
jgi:hypothetical protein